MSRATSDIYCLLFRLPRLKNKVLNGPGDLETHFVTGKNSIEVPRLLMVTSLPLIDWQIRQNNIIFYHSCIVRKHEIVSVVMLRHTPLNLTGSWYPTGIKITYNECICPTCKRHIPHFKSICPVESDGDTCTCNCDTILDRQTEWWTDMVIPNHPMNRGTTHPKQVNNLGHGSWKILTSLCVHVIICTFFFG